VSLLDSFTTFLSSWVCLSRQYRRNPTAVVFTFFRAATSPSRMPSAVHTLTEADTTVSVADRLARVIDFSTGRPLPLTVRRGDVYLCHPALAHCVGANGTSEPRVAAYFRVYAGARRTVDGGVQLARHSALLDPWLEYPSLKQLDSVLSCWSS